MFTPTRILATSLGIASLFIGANLARADVSGPSGPSVPSAPTTLPQPGPTTSPTPIPTDAVRFDCEFSGGGSDKGTGWEQHCHADGYFERHHDGNDDGSAQDDNSCNHLRVECRSGDDDVAIADDGGDDHDHYHYDDGARVRFDHDARALWIEGFGHNAPKIVIDLGDRTASTLDDGGDDHGHPADIAYTFEDNMYDISGHCRLHKPTPPPVMK